MGLALAFIVNDADVLYRAAPEGSCNEAIFTKFQVMGSFISKVHCLLNETYKLSMSYDVKFSIFTVLSSMCFVLALPIYIPLWSPELDFRKTSHGGNFV
jgi:hypothetical protein